MRKDTQTSSPVWCSSLATTATSLFGCLWPIQSHTCDQSLTVSCEDGHHGDFSTTARQVMVKRVLRSTLHRHVPTAFLGSLARARPHPESGAKIWEIIPRRARHRPDGHVPQRDGPPTGTHQRVLHRGSGWSLRLLTVRTDLAPGTMDTPRAGPFGPLI